MILFVDNQNFPVEVSLKRMRLVTHSPFPPGGYPFEQVIDGKVYKFPDIGLNIEQQAQVVLKFRRGNGLDRATLAQTIEDIDVFTCARLGNDPRFCGGGTGQSKQAIHVQKVQSRGCAGCGARLR